MSSLLDSKLTYYYYCMYIIDKILLPPLDTSILLYIILISYLVKLGFTFLNNL